jgi:threonine dehydratase
LTLSPWRAEHDFDRSFAHRKQVNGPLTISDYLQLWVTHLVGTVLKQAYELHRKILDAGLLICLSMGALYAGARTGLTPQDPTKGVAVVFAPWTSASAVVTQAVAAGSRFVRFGGLPFIAIVMPDDAAYADRMFSEGAWLVVDSQTPDGCFSANRNVGKDS